MCHKSGSRLVWQFPRLPVKVVEEEKDQIVMLGFHLNGALSSSRWRHHAYMNVHQVFSRKLHETGPNGFR